jgi:hypothetical protein
MNMASGEAPMLIHGVIPANAGIHPEMAGNHLTAVG